MSFLNDTHGGPEQQDKKRQATMFRTDFLNMNLYSKKAPKPQHYCKLTHVQTAFF